MNPEGKILIVDDEEFHQELLKDVLASRYHLTLAFSGEEALEIIKQDQFDLILLDVSMPRMSGYEVCERIRKDSQFQDIPVVFVSAMTTVEEQMKGYSVGGDDYIVKPFEPKEIESKVKRILGYRSNHHQLTTSLKEATQAAMEAMSGSSEMGLALQYIERCNEVKSEADLADLLIQACLGYGLHATVLIKSDSNSKFYGFGGQEVSPLEAKLITTIREKERLFSFDQRTQFNWDQISLLIKNMPTNDDHKYGRFKDLLPLIIGVFDSQVQSLKDQATVKQHQLIKKVISEVRDELNSLDQRLSDAQSQFTSVVENLQSSLEKELPFMGLEEEQEQILMTMIDGRLQQAKALANNNQEISESTHRIFEVLNKISK